MGISNNLGLLNADRYINWSLPFNQGNAKQAILTFKGDVYQGIAIDDFDKKDANHNKLNYKKISHFNDMLKMSNETNNSSLYTDNQYEDDLEKWSNEIKYKFTISIT